MKIEKLIKIFEDCIPHYQKAVDEKWDFDLLYDNFMKSGLCWFIGKGMSDEYEDMSEVFRSYYKNYIDDFGYLYRPVCWEDKNQISKCIKPRLKFLKQQIKELKQLQNEGYTDV